MRTNGEVRSWARTNVAQFFGQLIGLVAMATLLETLVSLVVSILILIVQGLFGSGILAKGTLMRTLADGGAQLLALYVLAPYLLGACRELMEIFRDNAPSASRALSWFKDPLKRAQARKLIGKLLLRILLIGLAGMAIQYLLALLANVDLLKVQMLLNIDASNQGPNFYLLGNERAFILLAGLVDFAAFLCMLIYVPALFFQAADVSRSPQQCITACIQRVKGAFGSYMGLVFVVELQSALVFVAVILLLVLITMILSVLGLVLTFVATLLLLFILIGYVGLAIYIWAREREEEGDPLLDIVD